MREAPDLERTLHDGVLAAALGQLVGGARGRLTIRVPGGRPLTLPPTGDGPAASDGPGVARSQVVVLGRDVGAVELDAPADGPVDPGALVAAAAGLLADRCQMDHEVRDLARELADAYEELNLFYELSGALAGARDVRTVCRAVLERAARLVPAAAGRILLLDANGEPSIVGAFGGPGGCVAGPALQGASAQAVAECSVVLTEGHAACPDGWEAAGTAAVASVPMRLLGDSVSVLGVLQLRDRSGGPGGAPRPFASGELKLLQALADQAALFVEHTRLAALERELGLARTIQRALLPAEAPALAGVDVDAVCLSARSVGGDYYDLLETPSGELCVVLADVSGHNLPAALLQTAVRATMRAAVVRGEGPAGVLTSVNAALLDDLERAGHFLTAWVGMLDTSSGRLRYEAAGHPGPLVHRAAGLLDALAGGGLPVGVAADGAFRERDALIGPGDVLLAYTDGVVEARRGDDPYGTGRLAAALAAHAAGSAAEIVAAVVDDLAAFAPERADDRTLVVLKRGASKVR